MVVRVKAEISPGYHLYSVTQPPGGPNPTIIAVAPGQPLTVMGPPQAWPKPHCVFDTKFGMETEYHVGSVIFDVGLRAEAGLLPGPREVVLQIEYQLCDEHTCLRPAVTELRTVVSVEAAPAVKETGEAASAATVGQQSSDERLRQLLQERELGDKLEAGLRSILADDPQFVGGYSMLASRRAARGDLAGQRAWLRKGMVANPGDHGLNFAMTATNPTAHRRLLKEFVRRFPQSQYKWKALWQLACQAANRAEACKLLERAYGAAPIVCRLWLLRQLCPLLVERYPARAVHLLKAEARHAAKTKSLPEIESADELVRFYTSVLQVYIQLKKHKTAAALSAAQQLREPEIPHIGASPEEKAVLALTQTKALVASGQVLPAYELLVQHPLLIERKELLDEAKRLGSKLHKSRRQVEEEGWQARLQETYPIADFVVPSKRGRSLCAQDYRGRLLLVNVWHPG